jgi:hypothetical protein
MMFEPQDIEAALVALLKEEMDDLKLVDLHEPTLDVEEIGKLLTRTPFSLVVCTAEAPDNELGGSGGSGMITQEYNILVGARALASKVASVASIRAILSTQRGLLDGKCLTIDVDDEDVVTKPFSWAGNFFEFSEGGLICFSQRFKIYQI